MPAHQRRHRSIHAPLGRRGASLIASAALAVGLIASDATDLGAALSPSSPAGGAESMVPDLAAHPGSISSVLRPAVSTTALAGAGAVSMAAVTASPFASVKASPAVKSTPVKASAKLPPTAKAPAKAAAKAAAKAPAKAPARGPAPGAASLSVVTGASVGAAVPIGLAAARTLAWSAPVLGTRVSSGFGPRWGRMHAGLDFAGPIGTTVRSAGLGVVTFAGSQGGYGNKIEVTLWDGTEVHYGHLSRIDVKVGERVTTGEKIGALGNSGRSTGPHLHLEVRPDGGAAMDPRPWLEGRDLL